MSVRLRDTALVPSGQHGSAIATVVIDVLERGNQVGDEEEADSEAVSDDGPDTR